jgi:hypothetical protein
MQPDSLSLLQHKRMASVRRLVIISVSAGAGFALALAIIAGATLWYSSRPERPKPWNSKAIVATFDYPDVEGAGGSSKTLVLYYTLENTTETDYRMPKRDQLEIAGRLRRQNSLGGAQLVKIDEEDLFFPAKHRRRFAIHVGYPIDADLGPDRTKEDQRRKSGTIAHVIKDEMPNLNGFVIFDSTQHYEIDFPNGWDNLDVK